MGRSGKVSNGGSRLLRRDSGCAESLGFRLLGDRDNLTLTLAFPKLRTFVRAMVSADGTISSYHYHLQSITAKRTLNIRTIELGSELNDGTFLTTTNTLESARRRDQSWDRLQKASCRNLPDELLRDHRERSGAVLAARPGLSVTRTAS